MRQNIEYGVKVINDLMFELADLKDKAVRDLELSNIAREKFAQELMTKMKLKREQPKPDIMQEVWAGGGNDGQQGG